MPAGDLRQIGVFDQPGRDPRGRYVVAYAITVPAGTTVTAEGDASAARWWPLDNLPPLAFDHADIITAAVTPTPQRRHHDRPERRARRSGWPRRSPAFPLPTSDLEAPSCDRPTPIRLVSFGYLHLPTGPDGSPVPPTADRIEDVRDRLPRPGRRPRHPRPGRLPPPVQDVVLNTPGTRELLANLADYAELPAGPAASPSDAQGPAPMQPA